jgi:hypothetical protein
MCAPSGEMTTARSGVPMPSACADGTSTLNRAVLSGGAAGARRMNHVARAATDAAVAAAAPVIERVRMAARPDGGGIVGAAPESANRKRTTDLSGIRAFRSLSRQRLMMERIPGGTLGGSALQSGSPRTMAAISVYFGNLHVGIPNKTALLPPARSSQDDATMSAWPRRTMG